MAEVAETKEPEMVAASAVSEEKPVTKSVEPELRPVSTVTLLVTTPTEVHTPASSRTAYNPTSTFPNPTSLFPNPNATYTNLTGSYTFPSSSSSAAALGASALTSDPFKVDTGSGSRPATIVLDSDALLGSVAPRSRTSYASTSSRPRSTVSTRPVSAGIFDQAAIFIGPDGGFYVVQDGLMKPFQAPPGYSPAPLVTMQGVEGLAAMGPGARSSYAGSAKNRRSVVEERKSVVLSGSVETGTSSVGVPPEK